MFDDDYYCRKKNFLRKILQEKLLLKVYEETTAVFGEFFSCWKIAFDSSDPYLFIIYYFNRIGFSGIFILHGDYSNEMECSSEIADVLFMAKEKFNRTENRPSVQ